jgi:hypothetical protein
MVRATACAWEGAGRGGSVFLVRTSRMIGKMIRPRVKGGGGQSGRRGNKSFPDCPVDKEVLIGVSLEKMRARGIKGKLMKLCQGQSDGRRMSNILIIGGSMW